MIIKKLVLHICLFSITLYVTSVHSALIQYDLSTVGDGLITFDESTELQWLDLSQSVGFSYNTLTTEFESGGQFEGWRFATADEWLHLVDQWGLVPSWLSFRNDLASITELLQLLGAPGIADYIIGEGSYWNAATLGTTQGEMFGYRGSVSDEYYLAGVLAIGSVNGIPADVVTDWTVTRTPEYVTPYGNYLVRTAINVPEPSTLFLLAISIAFVLLSQIVIRTQS